MVVLKHTIILIRLLDLGWRVKTTAEKEARQCVLLVTGAHPLM